MSAQANFVCFDGAATPVAHSMLAMGAAKENDEYTAEWQERIAGVPFEAQVTITTRKRMLKGGVEQVSMAVKVPYQETIGSSSASGYTAPPAIAKVDTIVVTGYFSKRSTAQDRRLIRQMAANALNGKLTSEAPTTVGAMPELFDLSMSPS